MNFGNFIKCEWKVYVLLLLASKGSCVVLYNDVQADFETLLSAYESSTGGVEVTDVMPKDLSTGPVTVYMGLSLYAIMDYDAVSGVIQLVASMKMEWLDEVKTLTGTSFIGSKETIFVGFDQIWSPNLVLMSSVDSIERIGDETYKIRYNVSSGYCKWYPRMIINAACTPDMTYYPFDKQSCTLTVTPWNRGIGELKLESLTNEWNTANMEKSGTWGVDTTSTETYIGRNNTRYYVDFKITIKRKPLFLALVIVLPVLLLSFLTGFLFLLPAASGSRVGFGITCFLSFIVLLQTLMSFMPEVSSPMSILCFYVIVMLSFSVFLSIVNVFLLRLHLNPSKEEVPRYFHIILEVITCKVWRRCPKCPKIKCQFLRNLWHRLPKCSSCMKWTKCRFCKKHQNIENDCSNLIDDDDREKHARNNTIQGTCLPKESETFALRNRTTSTPSSGYLSANSSNKPTSSDSRSESASYQSASPSHSASDCQSADNTRVISTASNSSSAASKKELTWEYIAQILDLFFLAVFVIVQVIFTVFFLVPLGAQY